MNDGKKSKEELLAEFDRVVAELSTPEADIAADVRVREALDEKERNRPYPDPATVRLPTRPMK